jgi:hypothetical protein
MLAVGLGTFADQLTGALGADGNTVGVVRWMPAA